MLDVIKLAFGIYVGVVVLIASFLVVSDVISTTADSRRMALCIKFGGGKIVPNTEFGWVCKLPSGEMVHIESYRAKSK